jgi:2-methylcitrate dehydratase
MAEDLVLDELVRVVEHERTAQQPAEIRHAAKRMILDSLGCAFGGFDEEVPRIVRGIAEDQRLEAGCSVFGTPLKVTPAMAAFANGVMIRYLDFNDSYGSLVGVGHPNGYRSPRAC